ncbi:glycerophosphodiester phosphodiesterase [Facklamia sp. DSM 111018]|uniref:Glycerophosphodiester phosphodiesterase n=1 Tax=Facklamia lactis TaxID=2749967 RepID=A0ABS0LUW2_9LACT|nr:glycerophosphodiester phosphodiesterase [Facklamia lactis]MBG9981373.1 glycerophosphodiester phosphodiesterase [Facklamia lactis]MBG9987151.1 glycerophosphodiester phosphodiesterase [Facklamia lactis]
MTQLIAHRGYSGLFPENTMLAFKEAAKYPIKGIELDVHLTKDNQIVIIHDESIDRTSNGKGYVKDMTLEELRQFDYYVNFPETQKEHQIDIQLPTLREFFEWFVDQTIMVNIELKTNIFRYEGINQEVLKLIKEFSIADRILISSFNHHSVRDFMEMAENLPIEYGFLTASGQLEPGKYCKKYGVTNYHPAFVTLDPEDILDCKQTGVQINTYTVNDEAHIKFLIEAGIDSIITNYIERALEQMK